MAADLELRKHDDYDDGLRAVAVLMVVCFHVVVGDATAHGRPIPGIEEVGALGVDLLFVHSGFCLAMSYLRCARASGVCEIDDGRFFSRRFVRIASPLRAIAVLLIVAYHALAWNHTF